MSRQAFLLVLVFILSLGAVVQEHLILSAPVIVVLPAEEEIWNESSTQNSPALVGVLQNVEGPGTLQSHSGEPEVSLTPGPQNSLEPGTSPTSLWQMPTIPPEQINHILCVHGSPACGLGQQFFDAMVQHGIDPALALGFFGMESSYGLYGAAVATRGIGNIRCGSGFDHCIDGFRAFHSWEEGFRYWAEWITQNYKTGEICQYTSSPCDGPLTTVEEIIPVYAPAGDNNDEQAYITFVARNAADWRADNAAGSAP